MRMNEKQKFPKTELITLALGELLAVVLTVLGFLLVDAVGLFDFEFSYKVITGALLGAIVIVLNFIFLSFSVNRAVDEFLELRGQKEMTDEEAEAFAAKHSVGIQNAAKRSMIVRTATIAAALVIAFLLDWFNPLATVIPILCYQPIITWGSYLKKLFGERLGDKSEKSPENVNQTDTKEENNSEACDIETEKAETDNTEIDDTEVDNREVDNREVDNTTETERGV